MRVLALWTIAALALGCRDREPTGSASAPSPTVPQDASDPIAARVDAIMDGLDLRSAAKIQEAEQRLIELGPAAVPALVAQLRIPGVKPPGGIDRRYVLARALRVHGAAARAAIPLLTPLLGGTARAIDQPQPPGSEVAVQIVEGSELRNASAEALGSMGAVAVPALTEVLNGPDPVARTKAASALRYMPPGALEGLEAPTADGLVAAVMAALPTIDEGLTRVRAIEAITRLPRASAAKALPRLRELATGADVHLGAAVARAVEQIAR